MAARPFRRPSWRSLTALFGGFFTFLVLLMLDLNTIFEPLPNFYASGSLVNEFGDNPGLSSPKYDSGLYKRGDVCNETFPGRYSQTCSPSNTLCCIIPGAARPACTVVLGYGFCCTEHIDCFVDLESQCDQSNSVVCPPNPGACCPQYTTCYPDFNQTESLVRCYLDRDLVPGYTASSATSAASTSASSPSSLSSATAASTATAPTSSPSASPSSSDNSGLSKGALAGIVISGVAALGLVLLAGFVLYQYVKRPSQQPYEAAVQLLPAGYEGYPSPQQYYDPPKPIQHLGEMPGNHQMDPRELPG